MRHLCCIIICTVPQLFWNRVCTCIFALYCVSCFNSEFLLCRIIKLILHVHYEHVATFLMTVTCPRYPAVPLSMRGMSAAKHILFTWLRAAMGIKKKVYCCCHFYMLPFWNHVLEYLCYLKRSSPTQTSWRTPHCSQGCWGQDTMTFQLNSLSIIMKNKLFFTLNIPDNTDNSK